MSTFSSVVSVLESAVYSSMTAIAVCIGWVSTACLLFHMATATKEDFKPRSVLYFLAAATLLFMHYFPPADKLENVIW